MRNTFRKPARLAFSVFTLALGGAVLISSINVRVSLEQTLFDTLSRYNMDSQFVVSEKYCDGIAEILSQINGVQSFSSEEISYGTLIDDTEGDNKNIVYDNSELLQKISVVHKSDVDLEETHQKTEKAFYDNNIDVITGITILGAEKIYNKHLFTVASFLIGASVIVILVGMISLVSISGINITERKKELGILRSFGADLHSVFAIVYIENLITGLLGFFTALVFYVPLSVGIGNRFGEIFLSKPLMNEFSPTGAIIWLLMSVIICSTVSFSSVRNVLRIPINKILSYE